MTIIDYRGIFYYNVIDYSNRRHPGGPIIGDLVAFSNLDLKVHYISYSSLTEKGIMVEIE